MQPFTSMLQRLYGWLKFVDIVRGFLYLGIEHREPNGHGQVDPGLQEGDDLRSTAGRRHHQHILQGASDIASIHVFTYAQHLSMHAMPNASLNRKSRLNLDPAPAHVLVNGVNTDGPTSHLRITKNGVVEENAEEHEAERDDLLPSDILDAHKLPGRACCVSRADIRRSDYR